MASLEDAIGQILNSSSFQSELENIKNMAVNELKQSIQDNFYDAYEPKVYNRTYQLLDAVQGEIIMNSSGAEINIFLDSTLMEHPSVVDGENSYVPPLLYYGHRQQGYDAVDYFHNYPANTAWFDNALIRIQQKVISQVQWAIVTAMKPTNFR